jgi:hypothetical protein
VRVLPVVAIIPMRHRLLAVRGPTDAGAVLERYDRKSIFIIKEKY